MKPKICCSLYKKGCIFWLAETEFKACCGGVVVLDSTFFFLFPPFFLFRILHKGLILDSLRVFMNNIYSLQIICFCKGEKIYSFCLSDFMFCLMARAVLKLDHEESGQLVNLI